MFENAANLRQRDAGKPLHVLVDRRILFEIFEQGSDRDARTTKHPGTADTLGIALDIGAGGPVDHALHVSTAHPDTTTRCRAVPPAPTFAADAPPPDGRGYPSLPASGRWCASAWWFLHSTVTSPMRVMRALADRVEVMDVELVVLDDRAARVLAPAAVVLERRRP